MALDHLQITDSTTRDELITYVNELEEETQRLETKIEDQKQEIEDLALSPQQFERLAEAADLMVATGRVHNTPKAKADWIAGK